MNKIVKDAMLLTIITLIAGISLGFVYEITKNPIDVAKNNAKQKAYQSVFESADTFEEIKFNEEEAKAILKKAGYEKDVIDGYASALDAQGKKIGYVISVTSQEGYAGDISFSIGVSMDGTVQGIEILSISETAGLGMKAKTPEFKGQFEGKAVEAFKYTKDGAEEESEIDALSGATITTNAMTNGMNAGLAFFRSLEGGGVNE